MNENTLLSAEQLFRLEQLLGKNADNGAMPLEMLDGFFSALIVGPVPTPPSGYLPHVLGEDTQVWTRSEIEELLALTLGFWNYIVWRLHLDLEDDATTEPGDSSLDMSDLVRPLLSTPQGLGDDDDPDYDPSAPTMAVYQRIPEDFPLGAVWAAGFLRGISLHSKAWDAFLERTPDLAEDLNATLMLGLFKGISAADMPDIESAIPDKATRLELIDALPYLLQALNDYRIEMLELPREPVRREAKPGRNDPCPCGSGKKYKKCHGAPGAS